MEVMNPVLTGNISQGWAGSCENWKFQTDYFGRHGDFQVCIYENRGSGYSSAPSRDYRMTDMARDAVDLLKHLQWKDNVHVVGVSMGGMIAQELALMEPDRIASLTLASTSAGNALPPWRNWGWLTTTLTKIALGLADVKDKIPHILYSRRWLDAPAPSGTGYKSNLEYMLKFHGNRVDDRPPQSVLAACAQLWGIIRHHVSPDRLTLLRNRLLSTSIPSMVVHGTEDVLVHCRTAWHLSRDLGARLVMFEGRGHALNHEDTDGFNRLLLKHFYRAILGERRAGEAVGAPSGLIEGAKAEEESAGDAMSTIATSAVAEEEAADVVAASVASDESLAVTDPEVTRKFLRLIDVSEEERATMGMPRLEWVPAPEPDRVAV
ncbi:hypothetical protein HK101_010138 [Irineochytrium annulatum]|nr:hypothetical protein HK101_010138 [Irineochytrium annulatum]